MEGVIEAESQEEALGKLAVQGLFPVSVNEIAGEEKARKAAVPAPRKLPKRITSAEILNFTQKLATLTRARVELLSSLKILYEQAENSRLQEAILEIYNATKEGKTFSESLERFPKIFSSLFVNIIKAGEASGRLDSSLEQISAFLSREEALKTKVKVALAYPTLLLLVGLASIFVLMNFVIPKLKHIFQSLGKGLPLVTRVIMEASEFSQKSWWLLLIVVFAAAGVLYRQRGSRFFANLSRGIKARLPIVKRLARNQELAHFARALGLLIKSGVPALRSLDIATLSIEEPKLREGLQNACREVASGQPIAKCMEASCNLPGFFTKMIAVGEESGNLADVLEEIAYSYTQQIEADIALIASIIEPILILGLGLILGTIILSILLPIFHITQLVR